MRLKEKKKIQALDTENTREKIIKIIVSEHWRSFDDIKWNKNNNLIRLRIAYFQSVIKTICEDLVLLDKIILTHRLFCYYCTIL